ncbi:MAG TPA: hypothetical protein DDW27_19570 [Bacteroidales bacterium]|nr:hypothetical protein [Bacteroidales bacterium]
MRSPILLLILAAMLDCCTQNEKLTLNKGDQLVTVDLDNVKVGGEIGRRIDITVSNNLLKLDIDNDFLASFLKKDNKGYIGLGKLIDGTVKMAVYTGNEKVISLKNYLIAQIIKAQEPDGYIGNMTPANRMWKLWDIHEMGYIINGLITEYKFFGNKESLGAAERAADYIIGKWPEMPSDWEKSTSVAEHVAITGLHRTVLTLYNVTSDNHYLDFCLHQLKLPDIDPGIVIGRKELIEGHIYAYMALCLAQLELYRINSDEKLLGPTMKALDFMTSQNGMSISGGAGQAEIWTNDQDGRGDLGESCAIAYQLRVYDNLLRLKGDSRFGDIMERTIYNALFGAQSPDGRHIRYYTPLEGDRHYHYGDTYCCPCNYRRFISELPQMIYYLAGDDIVVNLYSASEATLNIEANLSVKVIQETDYPDSGHVTIRIDPSEEALFTLKLRIPSWCKNISVSVNGNTLNETFKSGTFAAIERVWKPGDQVVLDMPMEWRLVSGRERQSGRVAVMRGPLLFCLNPAQNGSLAKMDGADLGRIVIDKASIEPAPVKSSAVRPDGIACCLRAGTSPFAMGNSRNVTLILTEFADPDGKCTYFRIPDMSEAVTDELAGRWN